MFDIDSAGPVMAIFTESLLVSPLKPSRVDRFRDMIHGVESYRCRVNFSSSSEDSPEEIRERFRLIRMCIADIHDSPPFNFKEKAVLIICFPFGLLACCFTLRERRHIRRTRRDLYRQLDVMANMFDQHMVTNS